MRRIIPLGLVAFLAMMLPTAASAAPDGGADTHVWKAGETVVSFTFDGGYKDQDLAADILAKYQLAGTFYINSGYVGYPAYLDLDGLRTIARDRSEIGGGSLYNDNLAKISVSRGHQEVCDDRATLSQLGFQVTSFSYPYGADSPAAKAVVQGCGYNNARAVSGLYTSPASCASCPKAETLPPTDDFRIRTLSEDNNIAHIEQHLTAIMNSGGGWAPVTFSHVCLCKGLGKQGVTPDDFETLVAWVSRQPGVRVLTVDQVMGGDLKPIIGTPLARIMPTGYTPPPTSHPFSTKAAWAPFGFKIDQSQLIEFGIVIAVSVVATYRLATKVVRYERTNK